MTRNLIGSSLVVCLASCVIPPPQQAPQPLPWGPRPAGQPQAATTEAEPYEAEPYEAEPYEAEPYEAEPYEPYAPEAETYAPQADTGYEAPSSGAAGRWVSTEWASVTNPAMASADFYLSITVGDDGAFHGSWARYICLTGAYGIISCSLGPIEGSASGRLDAGGGGSIDLERLGSTALAWAARSAGELAIELPQRWQGDRVLYRSSVKR